MTPDHPTSTPQGAPRYWARTLRLPRLIDRLGLPFELRRRPGEARQELRIDLGSEILRWSVPRDLTTLATATAVVEELPPLYAPEGARAGTVLADEGVCAVGRGAAAVDHFLKGYLRGRVAFRLHGARLWGGFVLVREPQERPGPARWSLRSAAGPAGG